MNQIEFSLKIFCKLGHLHCFHVLIVSDNSSIGVSQVLNLFGMVKDFALCLLPCFVDGFFYPFSNFPLRDRSCPAILSLSRIRRSINVSRWFGLHR